jgi:hypothetical protein
MTNEQIKEEIIQKVLASPEIKKARHLDNVNNAHIQKKGAEAYAEIVSWIISKL